MMTDSAISFTVVTQAGYTIDQEMDELYLLHSNRARKWPSVISYIKSTF